MVYRNYWCNAEERKMYDEILRKNEEKRQAELKEKYKEEDLYRPVHQEEATVDEENEMIVYKDNIMYLYDLNTFLYSKLYRDKLYSLKKEIITSSSFFFLIILFLNFNLYYFDWKKFLVFEVLGHFHLASSHVASLHS